MPKATTTAQTEQKPLEQILWDAANNLRGNIEPSQYKHVVLSLIFLKYINDRFNEVRENLIENGDGCFKDYWEFYAEQNAFFIPNEARWDYIKSKSGQSDISTVIDDALNIIAAENESLNGALPKNYFSQLNIASSSLSALVNKINEIKLEVGGDKDIFGRIYEYCLRQFALKEGKGKGEFYTPSTVVALLCELIEPFGDTLYDGACGSGGMFIKSHQFLENYRAKENIPDNNFINLSFYGQELTDTTWRLAKMNIAIRGISSNLGKNSANTFLDDQHKDIKADFALENPPFNQKNWRANNQLVDDLRWSGYGLPPASNANYAWLLNTLSKLNDNGIGAVLLANGSLNGDGDELNIRKRMIQNDVVEAIFILPRNMFYTTDISVSIWILNKNKGSRKQIRFMGDENPPVFRDRHREIFFMDLRQAGHTYEKKYIELNAQDRKEIIDKFKSWRFADYQKPYEDTPGLCKSVSVDEVIENNYSLVPSRYIDFDDNISPEDFDAQMSSLQSELKILLAEEQSARQKLFDIMKGLGYEIEL